MTDSGGGGDLKAGNGDRNRFIPYGPHVGSNGPPLGVYVLSAVFAILAILCGVMFFMVPRPLKPFVGVLAPVCLLFSGGTAFRINVARLVLIQVLSVGLFMEAVMIFNSLVSDLPSRSPVFPRVAMICLTVWILSYLLRRDVRAAFGAIVPPVRDNG